MYSSIHSSKLSSGRAILLRGLDLKGRFFTAALVIAAISLPEIAAEDSAKGIAFFEKRIRPVLVEHCYACHSVQAKKSNGGLFLDTREAIRKGGDSGPAVLPGNPGKSLILRALRHEGPKMPNKQTQLPSAIVADFETWVRMGAPDPRDGGAGVTTFGIDYAEGRKHWAYQPVQAAPPPKVRNTAWPRKDIDRYILAAMEAKALKPADDAGRRTLLRRLSFDLTGLAPSPEQIAKFDADQSPQAIQNLVEKLLRSDQFGPHWARHWMDGVRFNDSIETVDHYRHWLAEAFNRDMPYDEFIRAQIAGDLLPAKSSRDKDANRVALQMLYLNIKAMDPIEGIIEVIGQQFLGVSINCAKCHDHKYDAFSQEDYYGLAGIFTSTSIVNRRAKQVTLSSSTGSIQTVTDNKVADTYLLLKGDPRQRGDIVPRRLPRVLAGEQEPLSKRTKQSGRLQLADWIADPSNPLTARVMANRIWQRLMGRGIVASANDFGTQGDPPSHPELLDYLADRFVKSGWSVKSLIREIVLSRTYQQSSRASSDIIAADLDNKWWTRATFKRLTFEQMYDSLHFAAGRLDLSRPPLVLSNKDKKKRSQSNSRALYHRDLREATFFDGVNPELLVERREASVTAPQMLYFLNNRHVIELASEIALRAEKSANVNNHSRVAAAYELLFADSPRTTKWNWRIDLWSSKVSRVSVTRFCVPANSFISINPALCVMPYSRGLRQ